MAAMGDQKATLLQGQRLKKKGGFVYQLRTQEKSSRLSEMCVWKLEVTEEIIFY